MFKTVKAVNVKNCLGLTKGKVYEVIISDGKYCFIKTDQGKRKWFRMSRFVQGCKTCEERKCNSCPENIKS